MLNMLELAPIFLTVKIDYFIIHCKCGTLWFDYAFDHNISHFVYAIDFTSLAIALSELVIPGNRLNSIFSRNDQKEDHLSY